MKTKYYRVKEDHVFWNRKGSNVYVIQNELFTEYEMKKKRFPINSNIFEPVEIDQKNIHIMFGARFENIKD